MKMYRWKKANGQLNVVTNVKSFTINTLDMYMKVQGLKNNPVNIIYGGIDVHERKLKKLKIKSNYVFSAFILSCYLYTESI